MLKNLVIYYNSGPEKVSLFTEQNLRNRSVNDLEYHALWKP